MTITTRRLSPEQKAELSALITEALANGTTITVNGKEYHPMAFRYMLNDPPPPRRVGASYTYRYKTITWPNRMTQIIRRRGR